jgi:hypothetical protein
MSQEKHTKNTQYESNPFKVIFRGFSKIFDVNPTWSIIIIVCGLLGMGGNFASPSGGSSNTTASNSHMPAGVAIAIIIFVMLLMIGIIIISTLYRGAVAYVTVKTIEGQRVTFKEGIGAAWKRFWTILYVQVIVGLKVLGGLILFIVPGIRAALRYQMALLPVFQDNKNGKEAMQEMKVLTKSHLIEVFGMVVAAGIIPILGSLFNVGGQVVMYPQLSELKSSGAAKPKVHWLNYLGFILIPLFLLFIAAIFVIALLVFSGLH